MSLRKKNYMQSSPGSLMFIRYCRSTLSSLLFDWSSLGKLLASTMNFISMCPEFCYKLFKIFATLKSLSSIGIITSHIWLSLEQKKWSHWTQTFLFIQNRVNNQPAVLQCKQNCLIYRMQCYHPVFLLSSHTSFVVYIWTVAYHNFMKTQYFIIVGLNFIFHCLMVPYIWFK